jgi:hypothetical protein
MACFAGKTSGNRDISDCRRFHQCSGKVCLMFVVGIFVWEAVCFSLGPAASAVSNPFPLLKSLRP